MARRRVLAALAALALIGCGCAAAPPPPADTALSSGPDIKAPLTSAAPATPTAPVRRSVHVIGDSVTLDSQPNLVAQIPAVTIDAVVGRPVPPGIDALRAQQGSGAIGDVTVFSLGTNGPFTAAQIEDVIALTAGHRLVLVTSHCPHCSWTDANNAAVRRLCTQQTHCAVADFQAAAQEHPEWFEPDGVHMPIGGVGGTGYARLVVAAIAAVTA